MTRDRLAEATSLLSAASSAEAPEVKALYAAHARCIVAALRADLERATAWLGEIERKMGEGT